MKNGTLSFLLLLIPLPAGTSWAQSAPPAPVQKIVDYLLADWAEEMHSTSIAQAMENLGMAADDDLRMQVGEYLRAHPDLHFNLRSWGANNYILSDQEKRIAKFLIGRTENKQDPGDLDQTARDLEIDSAALRRRIAFMTRAGLLESASDDPLGARLTERYARWGGPLRFNYHTISIGEEKPFAVW